MQKKRKQDSSTATYVIIALILGLLTYIEFAIVEYKFAWLSSGWVMFWLALFSVIKFILVIMFFMHLNEDDKLYTGFFGSGMLLTLGSFIGLIFLFTVASTSNYTFTNASPEQIAEVSQPLQQPGPKNQAARVEPPAASAEGFALEAEGASALLAEAEQGAAQTSAEPGEPPAPAAAAEFDREVGEAVYMANCAACHQPQGQGAPGAFPPLAGHAAEIYNAEGGRELLLHIVMFGLQGPIEVDGTTYNGFMQPWKALGDNEIASVVDHIVTAWGNEELLTSFDPITADEVGAARDLDLSPAQVHEVRAEFDLSAAPAGEAAEPAGEEAEAAAPEEEAVVEEASAEPAAAAEFDRDNGAAVYAAQCTACHQPQGQGLPGAFPPLADHVPALYNADGGREVLIHTVLFGMQGPIDVDGTSYNGLMPGWQQLSDTDIADVLGHIATAWDNESALEGFAPFTAEEIEAERGAGLSTVDVHAAREALNLQ